MAAMAATSHASSLDEQIERLNADITRHTASVHALEQKLLHPVNTRVAVFLSLANRQALELDSVELFVNEQPEIIQSIFERTRLNLIQYHGDESPEFCDAIGLPFIKAFRVRPGRPGSWPKQIATWRSQSQVSKVAATAKNRLSRSLVRSRSTT